MIFFFVSSFRSVWRRSMANCNSWTGDLTTSGQPLTGSGAARTMSSQCSLYRNNSRPSMPLTTNCSTSSRPWSRPWKLQSTCKTIYSDKNDMVFWSDISLSEARHHLLEMGPWYRRPSQGLLGLQQPPREEWRIIQSTWTATTTTIMRTKTRPLLTWTLLGHISLFHHQSRLLQPRPLHQEV